MRVTIRTIAHSAQRYDTLGDWQFRESPDGDFEIAITVSATGDWRADALIAIHELVEAVLCRDSGVSAEAVDEFDTRPFPSPSWANGEPGDRADAPYHREHCFATSVERMCAAAMAFAWGEYETICERTQSHDS